MKTNIRRNVFETNSSSIHSLTMVNEEEYNRWQRGEIYIDEGDNFYTPEEVLEKVKKYCPEINSLEQISEYNEENDTNLLREMRIYSFEDYWEYYEEECYYEGFAKTFTTKNGDRVVAFGYSGSDY